MIDAITFEAKTVDADVERLISKIEVCKLFGWTPREYGEQKWTDLRKIKNYIKALSLRSD